MRWMVLAAAGLSVPLLTLCVSCDDDGSTSSTGGGAGAGGGGGTTTTTSSPDCHGDPTAWDEIEQSNIPCTNNSDCCVVFNSCTAAGQVVG